MQLNLISDFDLFALFQFHFIERENHSDDKVCRLFSLSPMQHAHETWSRQACSPDIHYQKIYELYIL